MGRPGVSNESGTMLRLFVAVVATFGGLGYVHAMTTTPEALYEEDFYAWTQQQAGLLRRSAFSSNSFDAENMAEEIEDLGRSELRAAQSLVEHIVEHLLKLEFSWLEEPAEHWRDEIVERRLQLDKTLTRSIAAKLDLAARYRAALPLERDAPGFAGRLPASCPYTLEEIVSGAGEEWFPTPRAHEP